MPRKKPDKPAEDLEAAVEKKALIYDEIDPIDRIPEVDFDEGQIVEIVSKEKTDIDTHRSEWFDRKIEFLDQWDNYLDYPGKQLISGVKNIHLPMTFEKLQAWHARMYKAIFAVDPIFTCMPFNNINVEEAEATKQVMWWYLVNEINYETGMKPFVDELLWDLGTDGWAISFKSWRKIQRKMIDIEAIERDVVKDQAKEAFGELKKTGKIRKDYREIEKLVTKYNGCVLETVPHECVYFPDFIPTSGDMNHPSLIMLEREYSEEELRSLQKSGYFEDAAVKEILEKGKSKLDPQKEALKQQRQENQGVREWNRAEGYPIFTVFLRKDLTDDKYPQEYIFHVSLKAQKIARVTYLDRVCRDGNRPVYKFDLLKRPRSAYSRGFPELLYPFNLEVDEYHNVRRIGGMMTNIPWGFYRPGGGLEKEEIKISFGKFYPTDDPQSDVRAMEFGNKTAWALQEEGLTQSYADRLTSMPSIMQGQVPQAVGPLRSTSGVTALMNEAMVPLDVYLDRFRIPFGKMLQGVHSDIQQRLPMMVKALILGEKGEYAFKDVPKARIMGKYKFNLAANDAQYNPEKDRQNAIVMSQALMSNLPVTTGVVNVENIYNILHNMLEKNNIREIEKYITAPQKIDKPLNLFQEYMSCMAGKVPNVVLNDEHEAKIKGLDLLMQHPEHQVAKENGVASPVVDVLIQTVIAAHAEKVKIIQSLQKQQNQSGMEVPVTTGSRSTGQVSTEAQQNKGAPNEGTQATPAGGTGNAEGNVPESGVENLRGTAAGS